MAIDLSRNRLLAIPLLSRDYHDRIQSFVADAFTNSEIGKVDSFDYGNGKHNI